MGVAGLSRRFFHFVTALISKEPSLADAFWSLKLIFRFRSRVGLGFSWDSLALGDFFILIPSCGYGRRKLERSSSTGHSRD